MLQKPGTLKWELPGGHANPGESMSKAAIREVREELGTRIQIHDLKRVQQIIDNKYKTNIYVYTLPVKQKPRLSDEHVAYKWLKANELDSITLSASTNHLAILSALTNG